MPKQSAAVKPQDDDIGDVKGGTNKDVAASEDQKRADGVYNNVGEHDPSPAATAGQQPGGTVLDTYGLNTAQPQHGNIAGPAQPLVVGQAPDAPNTPRQGSENFGHKFHPDVPNPKNQSPVVRGPDSSADTPTYADLRREAAAKDGPAPAEVQPVE